MLKLHVTVPLLFLIYKDNIIVYRFIKELFENILECCYRPCRHIVVIINKKKEDVVNFSVMKNIIVTFSSSFDFFRKLRSQKLGHKSFYKCNSVVKIQSP